MATMKRRPTAFTPDQVTSNGVASPPSSLSPVPPTAANELSRDEIATLAYSYWENRQGQDGSAEEDWLRAEQELRSKTVGVKTMGSGSGA
jgi:hypothetical protein